MGLKFKDQLKELVEIWEKRSAQRNRTTNLAEKDFSKTSRRQTPEEHLHHLPVFHQFLSQSNHDTSWRSSQRGTSWQASMCHRPMILSPRARSLDGQLLGCPSLPCKCWSHRPSLSRTWNPLFHHRDILSGTTRDLQPGVRAIEEPTVLPNPERKFKK